MKTAYFMTGLAVMIIGLMGQSLFAQNLLVNPESVIYDTVANRYLVSNFGNGAIVQVAPDGTQEYFNTELLNEYSLVGLHIREGYLYVSANGIYMGIKIFDLATGNITGSIDIPGAFFLNDVTSDTSGFLYVTDSDANRIYKLRLSDANVSIFASTGVLAPNGILFDARNNRLLVSLHSNTQDYLGSVDLNDSSITTVVNTGVPVDGVAEDDEKNIYISCWTTNTVYRFDSGFSTPRETVATGFTSPADIFFDKKHSLLAVPNFDANRLDLVPLDIGLFTRTRTMEPDGISATHGIGWIDINGSGYPDIYLANGTMPDGQTNDLYINIGGAEFNALMSGDIINNIAPSRTTTWGDCDNDGDMDVFVVNGPEFANRLYLNNGNDTFTVISEGDLVTEINDSRAAAWSDYDNDGRLDLFIANAGQNSLFKNTGTGFEKITDAAMVLSSDNASGACWGDYDNDGDADLFVAQADNYNNRLYVNAGDGSFNAATDGNIVLDGGDSYGGSWGDYDNDGDLDLFVPNMSDQDNFLYTNQGDGTFTRVTTGEIVNDGGCSSGSSWGDFDNDGDFDLFVSNITDGMTGGRDFLYQNNGDGSFTRVSDCEIADEIEDSHGVAWADYDRDGDLDLFVARTAGSDMAENGFYRNNGNTNNWLFITCAGKASNGAAIGTQVRVKAIIGGQPVWQMREISTQTGYGGQNSLEVHFGLGDASIVDSVIIDWPTGLRQVITDVDINQRLSLSDYICGDTNFDQAVNVGDAVYLINYIFRGGPAPEPECAGDANGDGGTNVGDAVYLINHVFKGGSQPVEWCCQ